MTPDTGREPRGCPTCKGTGAIDTPTSDSDPGCRDCAGTGVIDDCPTPGACSCDLAGYEITQRIKAWYYQLGDGDYVDFQIPQIRLYPGESVVVIRKKEK